MLKITGKLITVKVQKTKKDKPYKRLQLLCNGQQDTVRVEVIKDFQCRDFEKNMGKDVSLEVYAFPWVGKSGIPAIDYVMI